MNQSQNNNNNKNNTIKYFFVFNFYVIADYEKILYSL